MKLIAAYLLALLGGKSSPTPDDINSILASVGAEADEDKLDLLFSSIKGKDIEEVLAIGRERFSSGGGGGGGISVAAGGGAGGGAAAPAAHEEAKEEKKEEKKEAAEESDEDMGFSLFD